MVSHRNLTGQARKHGPTPSHAPLAAETGERRLIFPVTLARATGAIARGYSMFQESLHPANIGLSLASLGCAKARFLAGFQPIGAPGFGAKHSEDRRRRPQEHPGPPEPHSVSRVGQIRQLAVLMRCFGCPLSYLNWGKTAGNRMFLPHFLPHSTRPNAANTPAAWHPSTPQVHRTE